MHKIASKGFTIVEIATVIVVLAIISSVSVVGYGSWQKSLATKEVQTELKGAITAANQHKNFQNTYELTVPTKYKKGNNVTLVYAWGSDKRVCLNGTSSKYSDVQYYVTGDLGEPKVGQCPAAPADLATDGNATYGLGYSNSPISINFTYRRVEAQFVYFEFDSVNNATGYDIEYRYSSNPDPSAWNPLVSNDPSTNYEEYLEFSNPGETFSVRVRAVMSGGTKSDWSAIQTFASYEGPTEINGCVGNGGQPSMWFETQPSIVYDEIDSVTIRYPTYPNQPGQDPPFTTSVDIENSGGKLYIQGDLPDVSYPNLLEYQFVDTSNNLSYKTTGIPNNVSAYSCYS